MALTLRSIGKAVGGALKGAVKTITKPSTLLSVGLAPITGGLSLGGLVAAGKDIVRGAAANALGQAKGLVRQTAGMVQGTILSKLTGQPPVAVSTALPAYTGSFISPRTAGQVVGAAASVVSLVAHAKQLTSGQGAPMNGSGRPTGLYDRADALLGGLLPGGPVAPGGPGGLVSFLGPGGGQLGGPVRGGGSCGSLVAQLVASGQMSLVTNPTQVARLVAPPGYLLIRLPNGQVIAVLKEVAYALGMRKRPQKRGGISTKDLAAARRVQSFILANTTARKPKAAVSKRRK